jgi:hypothetical protein
MTAASLSPAPLRPIRVYLDDINHDHPIDAFTRGDRWNGFEGPFFIREQAAAFARIGRAAVQCSAEYHAAADEWVGSYKTRPRHHRRTGAWAPFFAGAADVALIREPERVVAQRLRC